MPRTLPLPKANPTPNQVEEEEKEKEEAAKQEDLEEQRERFIADQVAEALGEAPETDLERERRLRRDRISQMYRSSLRRMTHWQTMNAWDNCMKEFKTRRRINRTLEKAPRRLGRVRLVSCVRRWLSDWQAAEAALDNSVWGTKLREGPFSVCIGTLRVDYVRTTEAHFVRFDLHRTPCLRPLRSLYAA